MTSGSRCGGFAVALAAGAALACGDVAPTDPASDAGSVQLVLSETAASGLQAALDDARSRLVPGLTTDGLRASLGPTVERLGSAITRRDAVGLRAALAAVDVTLSSVDSDEPEVGALRLVFDQARLLESHNQRGVHHEK